MSHRGHAYALLTQECADLFADCFKRDLTEYSDCHCFPWIQYDRKVRRAIVRSLHADIYVKGAPRAILPGVTIGCSMPKTEPRLAHALDWLYNRAVMLHRTHPDFSEIKESHINLTSPLTITAHCCPGSRPAVKTHQAIVRLSPHIFDLIGHQPKIGAVQILPAPRDLAPSVSCPCELNTI